MGDVYGIGLEMKEERKLTFKHQLNWATRRLNLRSDKLLHNRVGLLRKENIH